MRKKVGWVAGLVVWLGVSAGLAAPAPEEVQKWLAGLSSQDVRTREVSENRLETAGPQVKPFLRKALEEERSLDDKERIRMILTRIQRTEEEQGLVKAVEDLKECRDRAEWDRLMERLMEGEALGWELWEKVRSTPEGEIDVSIVPKEVEGEDAVFGVRVKNTGKNGFWLWTRGVQAAVDFIRPGGETGKEADWVNGKDPFGLFQNAVNVELKSALQRDEKTPFYVFLKPGESYERNILIPAWVGEVAIQAGYLWQNPKLVERIYRSNKRMQERHKRQMVRGSTLPEPVMLTGYEEDGEDVQRVEALQKKKTSSERFFLVAGSNPDLRSTLESEEGGTFRLTWENRKDRPVTVPSFGSRGAYALWYLYVDGEGKVIGCGKVPSYKLRDADGRWEKMEPGGAMTVEGIEIPDVDASKIDKELPRTLVSEGLKNPDAGRKKGLQLIVAYVNDRLTKSQLLLALRSMNVGFRGGPVNPDVHFAWAIRPADAVAGAVWSEPLSLGKGRR